MRTHYLLKALTFATSIGLAACGTAPEGGVSALKDEAHSCKRVGHGKIPGAPAGACQMIDSDYHGYATCVGNGGLIVHDGPNVKDKVSTRVPSCDYGERVYVQGLFSNGGTYWARLPGWSSSGGIAYVDYRWLVQGDVAPGGHGSYP